MARDDVSVVREAVRNVRREPRILCWNCKKLTPFHEDRCENCGARFAGSTGGRYATPETSRTPRTKVPPPKIPASATDELSEARRTLLQLFEDLQRVHDVSSTRHYDADRGEESVTLFQCPSCGRFVAEAASNCVCGVRFSDSPATFACPECGAQVPALDDACPVCRARFVPESRGQLVYQCPRCGAEVAEDATTCHCGARFKG